MTAAGVGCEARRPIARRRRIVFAGFGLLLVWLVIEIGGLLTWWSMAGEFFTWSRAAATRAVARGDVQADSEDAAVRQAALQQVVNPGTALHPYLGYVDDADLAQIAGFAISDYGFLDPEPPLHRRTADTFVVGLVGGSVALQLGLYADDVLVAELEKSPSVRGRRVKVVRLALGGYKQPQQIFAVQLAWLRGGEFDLLLNLDGFNEIAMVRDNVAQGVPGWFPRGWARLMDRVPTPDQQRRLGQLVVLREQRVELAGGADAGWWSPTLQCLWLWRDRRLASRIAAVSAAVETAAGELPYAARGPGTEGRDEAASRLEMVEVWRRASLELQALCRLHDTRYFHFLQPNQYVPGAKPIGAEEAAVALFDGERSMRPAVEHGYPLLQQAGRELVQDGVAFTDLSGIFAEHPEPLYVDTCCHFGRAGNVILATRMVAAVRSVLDLAGLAPTALRVQPTRLRVQSPVDRVAPTVLAVAADGRTVDVAAVGLGTRYAVDPPGLLAVGADGALQALRRGRATVRIEFRGQTAQLEVVADWPDELVLDDGAGAEGTPAPRLRVVEAPAGELMLGCAGLPTEGFRLLAASAEPLPATLRPGQEGYGVATTLLDGTALAVTASSPLVPAAGEPLFLRVYVVDAASAVIVAVSNTVVITRG